MSLTARPGQSIAPIEAGNHHGVCVAVVDLGTQYNEVYKKEQPKIMITWELPDFPIDTGFRVISKEYTAILHEKSNLYSDLVSWRGRNLRTDELEGFNVKKLLGANCLVNVVHVTKGTNTYANVSAVAKLPKAMPSKPGTYQLLYDMDEGITPIPEGVPQWIKDKIMKSSEYLANQGEDVPSGYSDDDTGPPVGDEDLPF